MINKHNLDAIIHANQMIEKEIKALVSKDKTLYFDQNISYVNKIKMKLEEKICMIKYPIKNKAIGGFIYKTKNNTFCFINSLQSRAYENFVLLHEFYHLNYQLNEIDDNIVYLDDENSIISNERKASFYASLMLLEDDSLRSHYYKFNQDMNYSFEDTLCLLIDLFQVPTKTLLIRLYELGCINNSDDILSYIDSDDDISLLPIFEKLGLDSSIIEPSKVIKFSNIEQEFSYAQENQTMLETFIEENKIAYIKLLQTLKENNDDVYE